MKWLLIAFPILCLFFAAPAMADQPLPGDYGYSVGISPGEVTATPEMWFYEQHIRRYQDPKAAVRQKAEDRSAQRRGRIAARRWFGFSNIRPKAGTDVVHGDAAPGWSGRNVNYPFRWSGYGTAAVVVRPNVVRRVY